MHPAMMQELVIRASHPVFFTFPHFWAINHRSKNQAEKKTLKPETMITALVGS